MTSTSVFFKSVFFICLVLFFSSCEKEEVDNIGPNVVIISPDDNQFFQYQGNIRVRASVVDETNIERLVIRVRDLGGATVLGDLILNPMTTEYNLDVTIPVDNKYIESGEHFLTIIASDGKNERSFNRKIFIQGLPLVRRWITVAYPQGGNMRIDTINQFGISGLFKTVPSDLLGMGGFSREGFVTIAGRNTSDIVTYNLRNGEEEWSVANPNTSPTNQFFGGFFTNDLRREIFVVNQLEEIRGWRPTGNALFLATIPPQRFAVSTSASQERLVVAFRNTANQFFIRSHFRPSTMFIGERALPNTIQEVNGLFPRSTNEFYIAVKENNIGKLYTHILPPTNTFSEVTSFSTPINSVDRINASEYAIATQNGIFILNVNSNNPTVFRFNVNARKIIYDRANDALVAAVGSSINVYSLANGNLILSRNVGAQIADFAVTYNK
ncbi:MAG: hypothetical protein ACXITV_00885 [Luteibaculaceae bacterium]